MNELKGIRWKQRFSNFEKIYKLLLQYVNKPIENDLERAGMIQFFEISFELARKMVDDIIGLYFPELRKFYNKMNDEKMKVEDM